VNEVVASKVPADQLIRRQGKGIVRIQSTLGQKLGTARMNRIEGRVVPDRYCERPVGEKGGAKELGQAERKPPVQLTLMRLAAAVAPVFD
jgi:hypothetical protein